MQESNINYKYDSCVARGICSVSPRIASLQRVIVLYLKIISNFASSLCSNNIDDKELRNLFLNSIAISVLNNEFSEKSYLMLINSFKKIIDKYSPKGTFSGIDDFAELYNKTDNTIKAIQYGEKDLFNRMLKVKDIYRDLFSVLLILAKNISINILILESFSVDCENGYKIILEIFNTIDLKECSCKKIKKKILKFANYNFILLKSLRKEQEKRYGKQGSGEVSFSTRPSKAVLVVGSNIKELEDILEAIKDTNIDVYTHDEMMLAHTFPKFSEYKNLKGQYGQGIEHCLLDFSTFPGPIILTKYSLHNIDNFYRGRLYTTDYTSPQGIIKIKDSNFSDVIKDAQTSKGFKKGKTCESISIGYEFESTIETIKNKFNNEEYKNICFIGLNDFSEVQFEYFKNLFKKLPQDFLIISFSYNIEQKNLIHINACYDNFALLKIFDEIRKMADKNVVFLPECHQNTLSTILYLVQFNACVFSGNCFPALYNPSLMNTLRDFFKINFQSSVKNDLEIITKC